jgi:hypothetical protein
MIAVSKGFLLVAIFQAVWMKRLLLINSIFYPQTSIDGALTDIIPGSEGNRVGIIFFLHSRPPKSSNDSGDLVDESFGEKNGRHIVEWNGGKHRLDILKTTSMVEPVGFHSCKLGKKHLLWMNW